MLMTSDNSNIKFCTSCKNQKPINCFSKSLKTKDGLGYKCKLCAKEYQDARIHTKKGLIAKIYSHQRYACRKRGHDEPLYTLSDLREWAFMQPIFHELFDIWVANGYEKMRSPSFDRADDYKGYSLNRLTIITWAENKKKGHYDRLNGFNNKVSKSVEQLSLDGKVIDRYHSVRHAARSTGCKHGGILLCCNKIHHHHHNYIWRFC